MKCLIASKLRVLIVPALRIRRLRKEQITFSRKFNNFQREIYIFRKHIKSLQSKAAAGLIHSHDQFSHEKSLV